MAPGGGLNDDGEEPSIPGPGSGARWRGTPLDHHSSSRAQPQPLLPAAPWWEQSLDQLLWDSRLSPPPPAQTSAEVAQGLAGFTKAPR